MTISCLIATTPWSGSMVLCQALRATGLVGNPRDYFNPFEVTRRAVDWGLPHLGDDFAPRYLGAVAKAAAGDNGVLSVNLPWSHQRWLVRIARGALPEDAERSVRSDAEVLEEWCPQTRYLYLTCSDKARQALEWYLGRRTGSVAAVGGAPRTGQPHDFQEVRWIETLISRQERAWETYFQLHGIDVHRVGYETLLEHPEETVDGILSWLGLPGIPQGVLLGRVHQQRLIGPPGSLPDYLAERESLGETIGVRQGRH